MAQSWIIAELKFPVPRIPEKALLAAMDRPGEVVPELLDLLDETLENARVYKDRPDFTAHITALFLLAQFREPRAFPRVLGLLGLPQDEQEGLLGDLVAGGLPSILASLCAGDPTPLEEMAADPGLDPLARSAAMNALLAQGFQGLLPGTRLLEIFGDILGAMEARGADEDPEAWAFLADALAWSLFDPLLGRLEDAFSRGLVDLDLADPGSLESDLARNEAHRKRRFLKKVHLVEDAVLELEENPHLVSGDRMETGSDPWEEDDDPPGPYGEPERPQDPAPLPTLSLAALKAALARQARQVPIPGRIARNAPCPCGSGRKYKRCCGKA